VKSEKAWQLTQSPKAQARLDLCSIEKSNDRCGSEEPQRLAYNLFQ
jgi:hypothetical protein